MCQRDSGSWGFILSPLCCSAPWGYVAGFGAAGADSSAVRFHVQKCFSPLVLLMLLPVQTWQSFGLTPPPVSQPIFYFQWTLKFPKQKELFFFVLTGVCWGFFKCSLWRNCNILKHHWHIPIIRLTGSWRDWQTEGRTKSSLWTLHVMSLHLVEVMALRGTAGHLCISGFVQTPSFLDVDKMFSWAGHVNSQQCKSER